MEEQTKVIKKKSVFKNKNFALLFQGTLTSTIASSLYSFALSYYILDITNDNAFIQGAYLAMCGIVFVLMSFLGGILADRWNKVKIVYLSDFIKGLLIIPSIIPMYFMINGSDVTGQLVVLFIIGFISNTIQAIFYPASQALIPEMVEEDQLQQANSFFSMLNSFISVLGAVLGAVFYNIFPIEIFFLVVGVCYVLSGVSELFIRNKKSVKKDEKLTIKLMFNDFKDGIKYLLPLKGIVYLILGVLFINFFMTPMASNLIPFMVKTEIAPADYMFKNIMDSEMWSAIFSIMMAVGSIVMSCIVSGKSDKNSGHRIKFWIMATAIVTILLSVAYLLFDVTIINVNVFLIILCSLMIFLGVSLVGVNIPISVAIQKKVEQDYMAKVWSIITICSQGLCPIASLIGGAILNNCGISALLISCASGFLITALLICASKEVEKI